MSQGYLSHEKYKVLEEERIALLEAEVREWRAKQSALQTSGHSQIGTANDGATDPQSGGKSKRWWSLGLL